MNYYAMPGRSDEWYTPKYIFDAMAVTFDLDVAGPLAVTNVPARAVITENSLTTNWGSSETFIWANPPFGGRNGLKPWVDKFFLHGNGVLLVPDRTSAPWWHDCAYNADAALFIKGKVKFIRPDGTLGKSPGDGTVLFAAGLRAVEALRAAELADLGVFAWF